MAHALKTEQILFLPGIRQDLSPQTAPHGSLSVARNVRYGKAGEISMRPGVDAVSSATQGNAHEVTGSGGLCFLSSAGETPVLGTEQGKVFAQDTASGLLNFAGNFSTVVPVKRRNGLITERAGSIADAKYAIASNPDGYVLIASADGGGSLSVAIDAPDGTRLVDDYSIGSATKCSAIAIGSEFILVSQNGTTLTGRRFQISAGEITYSAASAAALNSSAQYWDICVGPAGTWYIVYQDTATNLTVAQLTALSVTASGFVSVTVAGNCPCSIFWDDTNQRLWVGWWNDPGVSGEVRLRAFTSAGVALCAVTTLATSTFARPPLIGMPPAAAGSAFFTYTRLATRTVFGRATLPGSAANPCSVVQYTACRIYAISKPDANQRSWCITASGSPPGFGIGEVVQERAVLLRWTVDGSFGSSIVELAGPLYDTDDFLATPIDTFSAVSNQSGLITFAAPRQLRLGTGQALRTLDVYQYEDVTSHPWRSTVKIGQTVAVAGQPVTFFGRSGGAGSLSGPIVNPRQGGAEIGFPVSPQITALTEQATGTLTSLGVYSYVVVLEWIGMNGERHRSRPSVPEQFTLTGVNRGIILTISAPNWGQRWDDAATSYPVAHVYRTEAGGQVHWRVTPGSGAPIAIDTSDGFIDYTDELSDEEMLRTGEALYTDQALADYDLAPSCRFMWRDERRVWFGGLWEEDQVQSSLDTIPGQPIECSDFAGLNGPAFRLSIGEKVTGGEYQDGTHYIFGRQAIYAVSGEEPDRQGNGEFSRPRAITFETGCRDYRSVRSTSRGIFFLSDRGFEIIPRGGGNPLFVGAAIQEITAQYRECLGNALHSDGKSRTVRFMLGNDGASQRVVEYDLDVGQWAISEYQFQLATIGDWPSGTALGLLSQSGGTCAVLEEKNSESYLDNGDFIRATLSTHKIRPWGAIGFGRLNSVSLLFAKPTTDDLLNMIVTYDETTGPTRAWTIATGHDRADYREYTVAKEVTEFSVTVIIEGGGSARMPVFHGIMFEAQPLSGTRRLPASSQ